VQKSKLYKKILLLKKRMDKHQKSASKILEAVNPKFRLSAENLVDYMSIRTLDLRKVQDELSEIGLSSISTPEAYTYKNIIDLLRWLQPFADKNEKTEKIPKKPISFKTSRDVIKKNTNRLFGRLPKKKRVHIMVTMPTDAADNYSLVKDLVAEGMDIARINLSHDDAAAWSAITGNVRLACEELKQKCKIYVDLAGPKIRTQEVFHFDGKPLNPKKGKRLFMGDRILLCKSQKDIEFGNEDYAAVATISIPSIIDDVQKDHPIWFDDGKMGGIVELKTADSLIIRLNKCRLKGDRFRARKGINLPKTKLSLPSLMPEDLANLDFVAANADIVGYSFVRTKKDVATLLAELNKRGGSKKAGIVLKIENEEAFYNLPHLILEAMRMRAVGVMLARGDLAVELGFERISEVQQQILSICESAHIPIIWATQVLENLAKKGLATRAEISDVAMAARAECIMLNKGPYILEAVRSLANILSRMTGQMSKNKYRYRPLNIAKSFFEEISPSQKKD
jgi:pyruvate kinase